MSAARAYVEVLKNTRCSKLSAAERTFSEREKTLEAYVERVKGS